MIIIIILDLQIDISFILAVSNHCQPVTIRDVFFVFLLVTSAHIKQPKGSVFRERPDFQSKRCILKHAI